jgi:hypothetical protein
VSTRCYRTSHYTDKQQEGARGCAGIEDADLIIVVSPSPSEGQMVKIGPTPPRRLRSGQMSLPEVYHHSAARKDRTADPIDLQRKCVVQAEWVNDGIREKGGCRMIG